MAGRGSVAESADGGDHDRAGGFLDLVARRVVESGYAETSVRELAAEGEVSVHALYRDYGTKGGLLVGAVNRATSAEIRRFQQNSTPSSFLAIWRRFRDRASLRALVVESAAVARRDDVLRQTLYNEQRRHFDASVAVFREWQRDAELSADVDAEALASILWAAEAGAGILEALGVDVGSGPKMAAVVARLIDSLRP